MKTKKYILLLIVLVIPFISDAQDKIDVLILNKKYNDALTEIDKQIQTEPSATLFFKQGMICQNLQDYQQALQAFSTGLQYEPNNVNLIEQSAECFAILGNNQDAILFYKKAFDLDTTNLAVAAKLGRVHINQKDYKNAYEVFSGIYRKDSSNVYWNKQLAYSAFRMFKRKQACYLYEKVLEANPRDYGSYSNLIHAYDYRKDGNKIMATISKGLKEFPDDTELLLEYANFFFKTKRYGPAMIHFENYLKHEKNPTYETMMNIGISTYFADFIDKALERFNKLQQLTPNDPLVMYYQSLCYKKLEDFEKSEELMEWAIDASIPNYVAEMYHHLGQIYAQQQKLKESIAALEKSYELNPEKIEVLFEIATTYEEYNSNKTLALNYYRIYLKEAGEEGKNITYSLDRITKLKEDLFFEE